MAHILAPRPSAPGASRTLTHTHTHTLSTQEAGAPPAWGQPLTQTPRVTAGPGCHSAVGLAPGPSRGLAGRTGSRRRLGKEGTHAETEGYHRDSRLLQTPDLRAAPPPADALRRQPRELLRQPVSAAQMLPREWHLLPPGRGRTTPAAQRRDPGRGLRRGRRARPLLLRRSEAEGQQGRREGGRGADGRGAGGLSDQAAGGERPGGKGEAGTQGGRAQSRGGGVGGGQPPPRPHLRCCTPPHTHNKGLFPFLPWPAAGSHRPENTQPRFLHPAPCINSRWAPPQKWGREWGLSPRAPARGLAGAGRQGMGQGLSPSNH
ncbi:transmembrane protein 190 isoform X1 [Pelodiscus sinensis]|uniref:transmembrane protein 190 isoform X1 n=1 Tax=Pelodiscus sinensis TaxID=13735 RepID=UPI003F6ABFBF